MSRRLVDTDILSEILKGKNAAVATIHREWHEARELIAATRARHVSRVDGK